MDRFVEQSKDTKAAAVRERGNGPAFLRSEDGSLIIFGLLLFILMLVAGGMGVDFMRFEAQRARLQATLDRAVLAAASMDQPLDSRDVVMDYFQKAGLGYYIDRGDIDVYENGALVSGSNANATNLRSRRVEAEAQMTVGASFLRFAGIDELTAPARGAAMESSSMTEISLVLDVSGSMGGHSSSGNTKIYDLREAAKRFINIVMCDPAYPDRTSPCVVPSGKVSVSLVPYAEQVLVGETLLGYFNPTMEHTDSSCVYFEANDFNSTTVTPTETLQRAGNFDARSGGTTTHDYNRTCKTDPWREITPVTGDAAALRGAIDDLRASGYTSIDLGMKWGSALLDPAAQPVVADLIEAGGTDADYAGRPFDWDAGRISKVIVLMTDGKNTTQYHLYDGFRSGGSPLYRSDHANSGKVKESIYNPEIDAYYWLFVENYEDYPQDRPYGEGLVPVCKKGKYFRNPKKWNNPKKCHWEDGPGATAVDYADLWRDHTWHWWNDWGFLPAPGTSEGTWTKNARLDTMCDAAKAQGITIFSVGFEVSSASAQVMKACASGDSYYYNANGDNLSSAFASIAREISKLRLVN